MYKREHGPSWAIVILGLILFWPLGVYFLLKKLMTDREAAVKKDNKTPVLGWLLLFIGLFFISSFIGGRAGGDVRLLFAVFFLCGGVIAIGAAKKGNQEGERFRSYINAIVNHGLVSMPDIAAFVQVSIKTVKKDLKKMVRMGYFEHAHLDEKREEIRLYQLRPPYYSHVPYGEETGARQYADHGQSYGGGQGYGDDRAAGGGQGFNGGGPGFGGAVQGYGSQTGQGGPGFSSGGSPHDTRHRQARGRQGHGGADPSYGHREQAEAGPVSGPVEVMAACRNCGANNWVRPGVRNHCEFCGSPISS